MNNDYNSNYRIIAKHTFRAHIMNKKSKVLIIFAGNIEEATKKAVETFKTNDVYVDRILPTDDVQIYEI